MLNVTAKIKGLTVVESGSVVAFKDENILLYLESADGKLIIELIFDNRDEEKSGLAVTLDAPDKLRITLVNRLTALGTSFNEPIKIATISSKNLYIALAVYPIGRAVVLTYTFYSE